MKELTELEYESYKKSVKNLLYGKMKAGECHRMLIELAEECKQIAMDNVDKRERDELEKAIPLEPR